MPEMHGSERHLHRTLVAVLQHDPTVNARPVSIPAACAVVHCVQEAAARDMLQTAGIAALFWSHGTPLQHSTRNELQGCMTQTSGFGGCRSRPPLSWHSAALRQMTRDDLHDVIYVCISHKNVMFHIECVQQVVYTSHKD